jgi:hypothetical protein
MANQTVNSEQYKNLSVHKLAQLPQHINVERFVTNLTLFLYIESHVIKDFHFYIQAV